MSIDMYLSESQRQAKSAQQVAKQQVSGYENLQKAINSFALDSPELKGKAYDSAKDYFIMVLYPLTRGGILLSEVVAEAVAKFPEEYRTQVDRGDLRESDLEQKIMEANRLIADAHALLSELQSSEAPVFKKLYRIAKNSSLIDSYQAAKRELEKKLDQLRTFNATSPRIFADIAVLQHAVNRGLAQTKNSWNASTGTFTLPKKSDMTWVDSINEQADKLAKRKADEEYRVFIKGRTKHFVSGLGYVWTNNPNGVTPEEIRFAIKFQQQINPSAKPEEDMTVTIMKSIKEGIDPITGNKLTTMQSTNWLFTLLLLSSKLTKGGKVVNFKGTLTSPNIIRKYQGKLVNKNSAKVNSVKKASGAGTEIGKHSVETLNRDQTRIVVENLLDNAELSLKDLQNMIPEGTPNTFNPTARIPEGAKYEFVLSDGQKATVRWHGPDSDAAIKYPNSVSGSRWTAQVKVGNKQIKVDGTWTKNQGLNEVHVPIKGQ